LLAYALGYLVEYGLFGGCDIFGIFQPFVVMSLMAGQNAALAYLLVAGLVPRFRRRSFRAEGLIALALAVALAPLSCVNRTSFRPPEPEMLGLRHRIKRCLPADEIRTWVLQQLQSPLTNREERILRGRGTEIPVSTNVRDIPSSVLTYHPFAPPRCVWAVTSSVHPSDAYLKITWGGHFIGYYGIRVGPKSFIGPSPSGEYVWAKDLDLFWEDEGMASFTDR